MLCEHAQCCSKFRIYLQNRHLHTNRVFISKTDQMDLTYFAHFFFRLRVYILL